MKNLKSQYFSSFPLPPVPPPRLTFDSDQKQTTRNFKSTNETDFNGKNHSQSPPLPPVPPKSKRSVN